MNKTDKNFDYIFVGSSPIILLEAMHQKKSGNSVLVLDDASKVGGAWTTIEIDSFQDLELGCHIWSIHKPTFEFLEKYLKIPLKPLKPQPFILKKGSKVPYDWKSNIITLRRIVSNVISGNLRNFKHDLKSPAYRLSLFPSKYLYPKHGSSEFMEAIHEKTKKMKLDIRCNTQIISVNKNGKDVDIHTDSGVVYKARHLGLTSLSNISEFNLGEKLIRPKYKMAKYIHVHLILNDNDGGNFSYIRWMDDDLIHRVSDVTEQIAFSEDVDEKYRVLIVGVHEKAYSIKMEQKLVSGIVYKLRKQKLIGEVTKVLKWNFNTFISYYSNPDDCIEIVKEAEGKISMLPSTDLIFGMMAQLPRWEKSLLNNKN